MSASGALLATGPVAGARWRALGVDVHLLVTAPEQLLGGRELLEGELAALDAACSRFREDSEVRALEQAGGRSQPVSALLHEAVRVALHAAATSDGAVDPTLGRHLVDLGYDRDFAQLPAEGRGRALVLARPARWTEVELSPGRVRVPDGVLLDLGATAKAMCADRSAALLADRLGCGVLVNLGGDLSVAGPAPDDGWVVQVQDRPVDPRGPVDRIVVRVGGLATSSSTTRQWSQGGQRRHHLLDPRTGLPAVSPWRTVSVTAPTCVQANTASTATLVRGRGGLLPLHRLALPARLVDHQDGVTLLSGWPA